MLLTCHLFVGEGAAQRAHFVGGNMFAVQLFDLVLDRQAVAVPAGDVRGIESGQRFRANDDVLENLVDGVTDMDVAVGVGRAVVEYETRSAFRLLANLLVKLFLLPFLDPLRLAFGEVAAHREGRIGQVQGVLVIGHGDHSVRKIVFCGNDVLGNLLPERIKAGKYLLIAQLMQKADANVGAVEVARKIE